MKIYFVIRSIEGCLSVDNIVIPTYYPHYDNVSEPAEEWSSNIKDAYEFEDYLQAQIKLGDITSKGNFQIDKIFENEQ